MSWVYCMVIDIARSKYMIPTYFNKTPSSCYWLKEIQAPFNVLLLLFCNLLWCLLGWLLHFDRRFGRDDAGPSLAVGRCHNQGWVALGLFLLLLSFVGSGLDPRSFQRSLFLGDKIAGKTVRGKITVEQKMFVMFLSTSTDSGIIPVVDECFHASVFRDRQPTRVETDRAAWHRTEAGPEGRGTQSRQSRTEQERMQARWPM